MATNRGGRPTKRKPAVEERILSAISAGNYLEAAAAYGGISYDTFNEWRKAFPEFSEAVEQAQAQAEVVVVAHWKKAIPDNWQAARDFLARRHPDRWGPKERLQLGGDPNAPLIINSLTTIPPPEVADGGADE
jgi:hypothetical protein